MDDRQRQTVIAFLEKLKIDYQLVEHAPARTMEDLAEVDRALGVPHAKNLFLCNRKKTDHYLLLMDGDKPFRTAELSRQIGVRLSFGKPESMFKLLQTAPGALSPFGLIFDPENQVDLIVDHDLRRHDRLCFHPCSNDASLIINSSDFWDVFLKNTGHVPRWVELTGEN